MSSHSTSSRKPVASNSTSANSETAAPALPSDAKQDSDGALAPIDIGPNGTFHLDKTLTADGSGRTTTLHEELREMLTLFEGKETEQNWSARDKSVVILRKITRGNAPAEYTPAYLAAIRSLFDGITKNVNSLRTSLMTNGCLLVQDIARAIGPGLDPMVESLLQTLVKLCGQTKKLSAQHGNDTVAVILGNVTCNHKVLFHIWLACQDKNVKPRAFAAGWLNLVIKRHRHHKGLIEHGGGLELMEKSIVKCLGDADPGVREAARETFWVFHRSWPSRAEA
jgi:CLIP-associating protein 1/2